MHDERAQYEFNQGLTIAAQNAMSLADEYRERRDRLHPVPYTQPEPMDMQPYRSTSDAVTHAIIQVGKPLIAGSVVFGTVVGIGAMVVGLVTSGLAFIGANAMPIGGGVVAVVVVVLGLFGARGAGESSEQGSNAHHAQNIHVTVNVAGGTVNANGK